ncbi:MAG: 3-phosphoshikimate 1-carboxyvinyltransferase [Candidatus Baltobacteraceae bacterium]
MILRSARFEPRPLRGEITLPGDKSISHRALILASASGKMTRIGNLNPGRDVRATADALRALGAEVAGDGEEYAVRGGALHDPIGDIDAMNSGSTVRMLLGLCTGAGIRARFLGDASLSRRPMEPVAAHLRALGARIVSTEGKLPVRIDGTNDDRSAQIILVQPSAQIKTALLFAALFSGMPLKIFGDRGTRDHTERMLAAMGSGISWNGSEIDLYEPAVRGGESIAIPGDFSAAAFFIVGATLARGSALLVRDVNLNPTRTGLLDVLDAMGARIERRNERERNGEPIGDLFVEHAMLRATTVDAQSARRAIDELPLLAVAAAFAQGRTTISGVRDLRDKESDRLAAIHRLLAAVGITAEELPNGIAVDGGAPRPTGVPIETFQDHRIQMAAAMLGCAGGPVEVDSVDEVDVSFPDFFEHLERATA